MRAGVRTNASFVVAALCHVACAGEQRPARSLVSRVATPDTALAIGVQLQAATDVERGGDGSLSSPKVVPAATDGVAGTVNLDAVVALSNNRGVVCTGSVVHRHFVLTAQHCLPVAEVLLSGADGSVRQRVPVIGEWLPNVRLDLALVRVGRALDAPPLRLSHGSDSFPKQVWIAGFGTTDPRVFRVSGVRHTWRTTLRDWGCDWGRSKLIGCSPDAELVLPREGGLDTCFGDSGGPVLELSEKGWAIIAVTSRSVRSALLTCGDGGVYVRTDRVAAVLENYLTRAERGSRRNIRHP